MHKFSETLPGKSAGTLSSPGAPSRLLTSSHLWRFLTLSVCLLLLVTLPLPLLEDPTVLPAVVLVVVIVQPNVEPPIVVAVVVRYSGSSESYQQHRHRRQQYDQLLLYHVDPP